MMYPRELFVMDEKKTEENLRQYRKKQRRIQSRMYEICEEIDPQYYERTEREKMMIRREARRRAEDEQR